MIGTVRSAEDHPGQVRSIASIFFQRFVVNRGAVCISGEDDQSSSPATRSCAISMSIASICEKMEDKRLTADRYSLHFEVCTRDPIGVGKRNGRTTVKPDIQKPSVGAEGFCLSEANSIS